MLIKLNYPIPKFNKYGINLLLPYDSVTQNFKNRIIVAGETIEESSVQAINNFVVGCKFDTIWDLLIEIGVFVGNSLNAALIKLKYPPGIQSFLTNFNFIESDYSKSTGLKGDGSTKYLDTGFIAKNHLSGIDHGLSVYIRVGSGDTSTQIGAFNYLIAQNHNKITYYSLINSGNNFTVTDITNTGLYSFNSGSFYRNGNALSIQNDAELIAENSTLYVFGRNRSDYPQRSNRTISFYAITRKKSAAQELLYYNRVQSLQQALGRAV